MTAGVTVTDTAAEQRGECTRCPRVYFVDGEGGWHLADPKSGEFAAEVSTECECGALLGALAPPPPEGVPDPPGWATDGLELTDPAQLERQIDHGAKLVEQAGVRLARAIKRWGDIEKEWKFRDAKERLAIHHKYTSKGERPPAEDIRDALVLESLGESLYGSRLSWQAEVEALEAFIAVVSQAITARQTLLNRSKGDR
jgi:hypothetical protein